MSPQDSEADSGPALIELRDLRKRYGQDQAATDGPPPVEVLHGINLRIHAGEFVAIVGASGSGKSTLMHLLGCLDRPSSGTYRFKGRDVSTLDADALADLRRQDFGFIFQGYHLIPTESAQENVEVPALYAGMPKTERTGRAVALLTRLGLGDKLRNRPNQLSGGQQQRVSIARALMNGGKVILADEPTGALDTRSGAEVMTLLHELADTGHTVILITHDRQVAQQARRVIELRDGSIVSDTGDEPPTHASPQCSEPKNETASAALAEMRATLRAAWRVMWVNRFRTSLTLLGIIIGVASVIVMLAVGEGSQRQIMAQMAAFGARTLQIYPQWSSAQVQPAKITLDDVAAVRDVRQVVAAAPYIEGTLTIRRGNTDHKANTGGTTTDFPRTMNWGMARGAFFTEADELALAKVAVLGHSVYRKLFPAGGDPVGQEILIDNQPFLVVGVLRKKGASMGEDQDNRIVVPFDTAATRLFGRRNPDWIAVLIENLQSAGATGEAIQAELTRRRDAADLQIWNQAEAIRVQSQTDRTMTLMLGLIAAISLVVGGIGVMNVMLMAVRERTREIGIRMATGARGSDILRQFLGEAVLVTVTGGGIGVLAGLMIGGALLLANVPLAFSWTAIFVAFFCAASCGLVFGYMPAKQAAQLDPVVALASE
ncbi:macrolide ABC transporter permease/ATP-binding protein MacB [Opitutaceae bacterium EW11]|nr:macrolide ABC transporter permease/ATP-binding protein MacB [Opitutaceae bacterium EW11]